MQSLGGWGWEAGATETGCRVKYSLSVDMRAARSG